MGSEIDVLATERLRGFEGRCVRFSINLWKVDRSLSKGDCIFGEVRKEKGKETVVCIMSFYKGFHYSAVPSTCSLS